MSRPKLEGYRAALDLAGIILSESEPALRTTGELELQARWFAGEFGREWAAVGGRSVYIEDFGHWNHEAGPDFIDARVRIDGEEVRGSIELDLDARDWERHGHAVNPAFRDTVAHLFVHEPSQRFFTRTCDHREVPQINLLLPATARSATSGPEPITSDPEQAREIIEAAARHRLDLKSAALRRHAAVHGDDAAWFAALAVALGYKRNQVPFLLLAQRVGLPTAAGPRGESLLFGVAGFLDAPQPPAADDAVRDYLRTLWEGWWLERARCERWILPRTAWQLAGLRPANHPHRRMGALAGIARAWKSIGPSLASSDRAGFIAALERIEHPFWTTRFNLLAAELGRPQALLGAERIRDMLLNIYYPIAVDCDEASWAGFAKESGAAPATIMRNAAERFFGCPLGRSLRSAVAQQGLLQIERDYRSAPEPEAFLEALRTLR
jgi:hypothetical protein